MSLSFAHMTMGLSRDLKISPSNPPVSVSDYEQFEREFIFNRITGKKTFGEAFCEKFNINDIVLNIIKNEELAKKHIKTFNYIR